MGDKGTFYVMDDDYIEQKYVRAEEERQRQEEDDRRRRAVEEAQALEEAERQRKAAEAERIRRKEESDRIAQLEKARQLREDEDRRRREREAEYQDKLAKVEDEMREIERTKANFITEKLDLAKEQNAQETELKTEMDKILLEKREILEKEQQQRGKMEDFHNKVRRERVALEQKEADAHNRLRELTQERRGLQNQMLSFLQQPVGGEPGPVPTPAPYSAPIPGQQPFAGFPSAPAPAPTPQPMYSAPQPQYGYPGYGAQQAPPAPAPTPAPQASAPSYPTYPTNSNNQSPGVQVVSNHPKEDALQEQLNMLKELMQTGVMTKEEYDANRKEALAAAGKTEASLGNSQPVDPKKQEVDKQIAQLDDYLRQGILQQADYDDAKKRVLVDAGLSDSNGNSTSNSAGGSNTADVPYAQIASAGTLVSVQVPPGKRSGDSLMIAFQGKNYNVTIPAGVSVGQTFNASI